MFGKIRQSNLTFAIIALCARFMKHRAIQLYLRIHRIHRLDTNFALGHFIKHKNLITKFLNEVYKGIALYEDISEHALELRSHREIFALNANGSGEVSGVSEKGEPIAPVAAAPTGPLRASPNRTKPSASWIKKVADPEPEPTPAPAPVVEPVAVVEPTPAYYETQSYIKQDDPAASQVYEEEPLDDEWAQQE